MTKKKQTASKAVAAEDAKKETEIKEVETSSKKEVNADTGATISSETTKDTSKEQKSLTSEENTEKKETEGTDQPTAEVNEESADEKSEKEQEELAEQAKKDFEETQSTNVLYFNRAPDTSWVKIKKALTVEKLQLREDKVWSSMTINRFLKETPYLSLYEISTSLVDLESAGLIEVYSKPNSFDRTKYYRPIKK